MSSHSIPSIRSTDPQFNVESQEMCAPGKWIALALGIILEIGAITAYFWGVGTLGASLIGGGGAALILLSAALFIYSHCKTDALKYEVGEGTIRRTEVFEDIPSAALNVPRGSHPTVPTGAHATPIRPVRTWSYLVKTIGEGTLDAVDRLLNEEGFDLDRKGPDGTSLCHVAIASGRLDVLKRLIVKGADKNHQDNLGCSLLHRATLLSTRSELGIEMVVYLLQQGVNPALTCTRGKYFYEYVHSPKVANHCVRSVEPVRIREILALTHYETFLNGPNPKEAWQAHVNYHSFLGHLATCLSPRDINPQIDALKDPLYPTIRCGTLAAFNIIVADPNHFGDRIISLVHLAVMAGRLDILKSLKAQGFPFNARDRLGATPLHWAVRLGMDSLIPHLVALGADVDARDAEGETPLHWSARKDRSDEMIRALVNAGANLEAENMKRYTPLLTSIKEGSREAFKALLELGSHVDAQTDDGNALHIALLRTQVHKEPFVSALLQKNVNVRAQDRIGRAPLHLIMLLDDWSVGYSLLAAGADPNAQDGQGRTVFHRAMMHSVRLPDPAFLVRCVLVGRGNPNLKDTQGKAPIHLIVGSPNILELIDLLVKLGANLGETDNLGETLLHTLARAGNHVRLRELIPKVKSALIRNISGETPLDLWIKEGFGKSRGLINLDVLALFKKAMGDSFNVEGGTAFFHAVHEEETTLIDALVKADADIHTKNQNGETPLHAAVREKKISSIRTLTTLGASLDRTNQHQRTPLDEAVLAGDEKVFCALLENSDLTKIKSFSFFQNILERGDLKFLAWTLYYFGLKTSQPIGMTPAWIRCAETGGLGTTVYTLLVKLRDGTLIFSDPWRAAQDGNVDILTLFMQHGIPLDTGSPSTPLHVAARAGHVNVIRFLASQKISLDQVDRNQTSALHMAVLEGKEDVVRALIELQANLSLQDHQGKTALHLATIRAVEQESNATINIFNRLLAVADLSKRDGAGKYFYAYAKSLTLACDAVTQLPPKRLKEILSLSHYQSYLGTPNLGLWFRHQDFHMFIFALALGDPDCEDKLIPEMHQFYEIPQLMQIWMVIWLRVYTTEILKEKLLTFDPKAFSMSVSYVHPGLKEAFIAAYKEKTNRIATEKQSQIFTGTHACLSEEAVQRLTLEEILILREAANSLMRSLSTFEDPVTVGIFGEVYAQRMLEEFFNPAKDAFRLFTKMETDIRARLGKAAIVEVKDEDDDIFTLLSSFGGYDQPATFTAFFGMKLDQTYKGGLTCAKDTRLIGVTKSLISMDIDEKDLSNLIAWRAQEEPIILAIHTLFINKKLKEAEVIQSFLKQLQNVCEKKAKGPEAIRELKRLEQLRNLHFMKLYLQQTFPDFKGAGLSEWAAKQNFRPGASFYSLATPPAV